MVIQRAELYYRQTAVYLATSPKSNSTYLAIDDAIALVKATGNLPVPLHLRNAPTKLMKDLDYGKEYEYAHNHTNNFVNLEFLPDALSGKKIYEPGINARENELRAHSSVVGEKSTGIDDNCKNQIGREI